ncbi:hypothetical protein [Allokutzneria sp. NRRL B-24872]|uniref:hypothetical protein n=1 Tax=Allokutzneria sp. NRRL B-24872 TaxID=1137961 RepID=UPI000A37A101|nr:hypothetical protein [Allokutzneria sp. NRRL B-24872]
MDDDLTELHPDLRDRNWQRAARRRARTAALWSGARRSPRALITAVAAGLVLVAVTMLHLDGRLAALVTGAFGSSAHDPARPFLGTPAAEWADGPAGFVPPPAAPIGAYTSDDVAAATEQVRQFLITSRLDRRVIEGHDARPVLDLLAPYARRQTEALLKPDDGASTRRLHTRIAKENRLARAEPKVSGIMAVGLAEDGALLVSAKYVIAYAFDTTGRPLDAVAMERSDINYEVRAGAQWRKGARGLWIGASPGVVAYSYRCEPWGRGFLSPPLDSPTPAGGRGDKAFFDLNKTLATYGNCFG